MWEEQKAWLERGIQLGCNSDNPQKVIYYTKALLSMQSTEKIERSMNDER